MCHNAITRIKGINASPRMDLYVQRHVICRLGGPQVESSIFKTVVRDRKTRSALKALANEDTLLRTHCCRHKCFPLCPRAQHLLRTQILCPGHKNVSDFVQKHFLSATNVSQFAQPRKHHGQRCVRNKVSLFARTLTTDQIA